MRTLRWFAATLALGLIPTLGFADDKKSIPGVQADGFALISIHVAQLWDEPSVKPFREALGKLQGPIKADLEKFSGMPIGDLERATLYWPAAPDEQQGIDPYMIFTARKPFERAAIIKTLNAITWEQAQKEYGNDVEGITGKNIYFAKRAPVIFLDDRTVILGPTLQKNTEGVAAFLKVLGGITPQVKAGPLADALAATSTNSVVAAIELAPIRKLLDRGMDFPEMVKPFLALAQAERAMVALDLGTALKASVKLTFFDADTAKKAEPDAKKVIALALTTLADLRKAKGRGESTDAALLPLLDFAKAALDKGELKLDGKALTATMGGELDVSMKKAMAAFPAWAEAETARMQASNNLNQIGIALFNYHDANGHCPQDVVDGDGKAILSWRVQLLPYIEQDNLYRQLDLTKPWDDAANKKFVEQMPVTFKFPGRETKEKGFTYFQMVTAPNVIKGGSPFLVPGRKLSLTGITDGTSNTLMVVDGETAVNWLKPGDLPYDPKKLPKIGDPKTGRFLAAMGDGSVRWFDVKKLGEKKLHALITIDGGEVVNIDE